MKYEEELEMISSCSGAFMPWRGVIPCEDSESELIASAAGATLPWKSIDATAAVPPRYRNSEERFWKSVRKSDKDEIEFCMGCQRPECSDCISYYGSLARAKRGRIHKNDSDYKGR